MSYAPVTFPRNTAIKLAKTERNSLYARAKHSARCRREWERAGHQANRVVQALSVQKDANAARAALKIGPYWKAAADCEGWATPSSLSDYDPQHYGGRAIPIETGESYGVAMNPGGGWQRVPTYGKKLLERPIGARVSLGADEGQTSEFDVRSVLEMHGQALERIEKVAEEQLLFRKIATIAAVAGAAFAMLRLTEIWLAVQERKERRSAAF